MKKLRKASVRSELSVLPLSMAFYVITAIMVPAAIILGGYLYKMGEIEAVHRIGTVETKWNQIVIDILNKKV